MYTSQFEGNLSPQFEGLERNTEVLTSSWFRPMRQVNYSFVTTCALPMSLSARTAFIPTLASRRVGVRGSPLKYLHTSSTVFASASPKRMPPIIRPVVPSETLCQFVEDRAQFRSTVLKTLSAYVKEHKLQDENNKRLVHCDEKLKDLFGVEQCTILEMSKYVSPHLRKPEDLGGRYVSEAQELERQYFQDQKLKGQDKKSSESSRTRRSRKAAKFSQEDQKAGRKLFKPVILSEELSAICRSQKEMPRQEIVKAVWDYIRLNNLQGKPGEPIKCDFLLKRVYNAEYIDVRTVMKGIGAHVRKKE